MPTFYTLRWTDGAVSMLNQRLLPNREVYNEYRSAADVADAIRTLVVRG
ncbi:MAG: S-methyl-5-thioribose-1-phosphate isomerase, partial [Armatimonadetes bacterium]|nr:S-methyl-5-thioribose-1-phosphate isomerase [Armatimonadota bacterium]